MNMPVASVIIVAYNGRDYLVDCLSSVLDDTGDAGEIILIDNGSADGGAQFVRERFPGVRLVENRTNRGFAAACNQGAGEARAETLVFLNQDTRVHPGWLSGLLGALDDGAGLATSKLILMSDPGKINACGQDVHFSGLAFQRGFLRDGDGAACLTPRRVNAVHGASFAVRRDLWGRLGGFDETFYMYYEETDLSWRARLAGFDCVYAPGSVVEHDYRPAQPSPGSLVYSKRNRYVLLLKNWRWATLALLSPGLLLAELADWGHALLAGRPGARAKAAAYGSLPRVWPAVMAARREAQRARRVGDAAILRSSAARLSPAEFPGGPIGAAATGLLNILLWINRAFALALCRLLNL
jgi:GT2 family glycosyltransferase